MTIKVIGFGGSANFADGDILTGSDLVDTFNATGRLTYIAGSVWTGVSTGSVAFTDDYIGSFDRIMVDIQVVGSYEQNNFKIGLRYNNDSSSAYNARFLIPRGGTVIGSFEQEDSLTLLPAIYDQTYSPGVVPTCSAQFIVDTGIPFVFNSVTAPRITSVTAVSGNNLRIGHGQVISGTYTGSTTSRITRIDVVLAGSPTLTPVMAGSAVIYGLHRS